MGYRLVNSIGLLITIVGCLLLYKFGLPPDVNPRGESALVLEQVDTAEIAKAQRFGYLGRLGITFIAIGAVCQIIATWIS
jgi:hypothetical protein